jgi:hypothetical protein
MQIAEKVIEMRTIPRNEIVDYFTGIGGKGMDSGRIEGQNWEVEVGQEKPVALGPFFIFSVTVILRCEKELFDRMYAEFCSRFLRGGG